MLGKVRRAGFIGGARDFANDNSKPVASTCSTGRLQVEHITQVQAIAFKNRIEEDQMAATSARCNVWPKRWSNDVAPKQAEWGDAAEHQRV